MSDLPPANVIFSAACAGKWYFDWFSEKYPFRPEKHIGVELSPAPPGLPDNAFWIQGDIRDLSAIASNTVDLAFAGQCIEHLDADSLGEFLCEVNRIVKDEGVFVLDSPNHTVTHRVGWKHPEHTAEYTLLQARELLHLAGFEVERSRGIFQCVANLLEENLAFDFAVDMARREVTADLLPEYSFIWWVEARKSGLCEPELLKTLVQQFYSKNIEEKDSFRFHFIGKLVDDPDSPSGRAICCLDGERPGFLLYGPYVHLPSGRYTISFFLKKAISWQAGRSERWRHNTLAHRILRLHKESMPKRDVAWIDVCSDQGRKIHARRIITSSDFPSQSGYQRFDLQFESSEESGFEFRVFSLGNVALAVDPSQSCLTI